TGPTSAAMARRQIWRIIGAPAMSASGFRGKRLAASRAGIMTIGFWGAADMLHADGTCGTIRVRMARHHARFVLRPQAAELAGTIRLSRPAESDFLRRRRVAAGSRPHQRQGERASMPSFEWNKIIASVLTAMIVAMVTGIIASSFVRPHHL